MTMPADPMEEIWKSVAKPGPEGQPLVMFKGPEELGFLYATGFVDVKKYNFKQWFESFKDSRQKDNTYLVTYDQWMAKRKFRFDGKVSEPFDPFALEERDYSEAEMLQLIREKVIPSTTYNETKVVPLLNTLKSQKKLVNGVCRLDKSVKGYLAKVMETHPSPTYVLSLMIEGYKKYGSPTVKAQKSGFTKGSSAQKIVTSRLAEIAKVLQAETVPVSDAPSVSLKDLQKKRGTGGRV